MLCYTVYYSRVSEKTNCCGICIFSAVAPTFWMPRTSSIKSVFSMDCVCVWFRTLSASHACMDGALLACAVQFLASHGPVPVHGLGNGDPWFSGLYQLDVLLQFVCQLFICWFLISLNLQNPLVMFGQTLTDFFFNPVLFYKYIKNYPELSKGAKASKSNNLSQKLRTITHTPPHLDCILILSAVWVLHFVCYGGEGIFLTNMDWVIHSNLLSLISNTDS